jgi:hypothetical protein
MRVQFTLREAVRRLRHGAVPAQPGKATHVPRLGFAVAHYRLHGEHPHRCVTSYPSPGASMSRPSSIGEN